jgi:hypothetical protein
VPVTPAQPGRRYRRPAVVRFYFDADVLGLAHVVARLRADSTYPGDPGGVVRGHLRSPCPVSDVSVKDPVWIPQVTGLGWLIITRDAKIQEHRAEIAAVRDNGARVVALGGADAIGTWAQLEVLLCQWRAIEWCTTEAGPFIYSATRTMLRLVELDS